MMKFAALALFFHLCNAFISIPAASLKSENIATRLPAKPKIQVALLLDTSNSMDGLIDQAKSQLWKMVNDLASAKKGGQSPDIEIGLYEYGNDGLDSKTGYIRQVTPMTNDLDLVSDKLFKLSTNGGQEYCGWVIGNATGELNWSTSNDDLKLIIIAGNEPFTQGPVDFHKTCKEAIAKGIMINTIFCGDYQEGVNTSWKEGSECSDGKYLNINQDDKIVHIPTPYDDTIIGLNKQLNDTYIGFGKLGTEKKELQMVQDANADTYGSANLRTRAAAKSKAAYSNASWDMVDAARADSTILLKLKKDELPENMRKMSDKEKADYVKSLSAKRDAIQQQINHFDQLANVFIAEKQKENAETLTLDNVMIQAVRKQAESKAFSF